ncbi:TPA_asm: M [Utricularia alphacytorhabdovirus 1]|nr:TPA_asm: M [Utricularia alphacytorhabdovirus 1]
MQEEIYIPFLIPTRNSSTWSNDQINMSHWVCMSISYTAMSLEYKGDISEIMKTRADVIKVMKSLINQSSASTEIQSLVVALMHKRDVRIYEDCITSPFFGVNTKRLNLVFPKTIIIPSAYEASDEQESITLVGKKLKIGSCQFVSDVRMKVGVTSVEDKDIEALLKRHPGWFIGDIGLMDSSGSPSSSNMPASSSKASTSINK